MAPTPDSTRCCLLVLGMHRSGTSALAGALAGALAPAGAAAPATAMPPHASNPRGFFESLPVRDFNDALLGRLRSAWDDWRPLPHGWHLQPEVTAMQPRAAALIAAEFAPPGSFVLKDPRICRLLPFWRAVLEGAGVRVLAVHTHRHPDAVAASLAVRYGFGAPAARLLWLRHLLEAEAGSRGLPRCFTSYDRLLDAPAAEVARIGRCLGVPLGCTAAPEFVSADLCTHRGGAGAGLPDWHRTAFEVLSGWSADAEAVDDRAILDLLRAEMNRAAAAIAPILDAARQTEAQLRQDLAASRAPQPPGAGAQTGGETGGKTGDGTGDGRGGPVADTPAPVLPPVPLHSTRLFPKHRGATAYALGGIAARCDWVVLSDDFAPHTALVRRRQTDRPRHVFLSLRGPFAALRSFAEEILPRLHAPFVLISGSEDVTIPNQTDRRWRPFDAQERGLVDAILDHPCLVRWWAENLDAASHPRLSPLPVGMIWPDGPPDPAAPPTVAPPLGPRPLRVLCAHRIRPGPQWQARRDVSALAAGPWAGFVDRIDTELSEPAFNARLAANSFVLCVEGGGLDPAPKAWTALLHGAIPILRDSPVAAAYRTMPVVIVPDWRADALDPDRLGAWKRALQPRFDTAAGRAEWIGQLGLEHWWRRILADAPP